jgi:ABC-2 type transport system ATP-binding protein
MLRIEHLTKIYGQKRAVDDLTLHVAKGELWGFIGHNGAGKTTTLKALCGLLDFDSGHITIAGTSLRQDPLGCKARMAYIPDTPELYDFLTGAQYLDFIADVYKVPAPLRQARLQEYAALFELTGDLGLPIQGYSHGMKQKLALLSAVVHGPELLVLDEPFVGLDPKAARVLKNLMGETCRQGGAVLFSTHVLEVAEKLCHKVAILKNGKLAACGDMAAIRGDSSLETVFFERTGGGENG